VSWVSAVMTFNAAKGTFSCSAAICWNAVLNPWPSSTLPVKAVMLPSASMRIQESR
jgi:hypothetical protein